VRLGDLVEVTTHTNKRYRGLVIEINNNPSDVVERMFPYLIFFNNGDLPNDWYRTDDMELISENR